MRVRSTIPVFAAAAVLLLSGCVDNSTAPESTADNGSTGTVAADAAAAALLPEGVGASGTLVFGTSPNYAPNEYKNDAGEPIGWTIDLADAIAGKLGLTADISVANFESIIPGIKGGSIDVGASSFTDNVEREKQVDFINYYEAGIQWASASGTDVDPDNACGLTVAVQATTYQDTVEIPAKSEACVAAGLPPINKKPYDTQDTAANAVVLGQAVAFSADSPVTLYAIDQLDGRLQLAGTSFEVAPYGFAVAKDSGMAEAVQAALQSMVDDGSYQAILDDWGVAAGGLETITINAATKG
ncbi:ABC transporter substrate-binding protein [Cryobacterium psychrophilum]|uniref:ABC transporter substrate-binding protein n=1 Tax=Cryobacterium psychrophilum TaxID=41988 RepID=A0A4Y8KVQ5_9MICO|nr:ABC transporter substrate-binding protein [Cryobacterium psychrophilum]TDW29566.1 polar amino acid transport system substrate-binding protein [Cryobacterium psychrophilum]TFD81700.1 ABC transporter substrate-binding protein [Cryobacterium psychrophilum]